MIDSTKFCIGRRHISQCCESFQTNCANWGRYCIQVILVVSREIVNIGKMVITWFRCRPKSSLLCSLTNKPLSGRVQNLREEFDAMVDKLSVVIRNEVRSNYVGEYGEGICWGASLFIIKKLFEKDRIKTEKDLIECVHKYKKGFPLEAVVIQNIVSCIVGVMNPTNSHRNRGLLRGATMNHLSGICQFYVSTYENASPTYLLNQSEEMQKLGDFFNMSGVGYYGISFTTETSGHMIVFVRMKFGFYLIDSNVGLIRCREKNPFETLRRLLQSYQIRCNNPTVAIFKFLKEV